jgi:two-component system chemotaxis response regulator CheY
MNQSVFSSQPKRTLLGESTEDTRQAIEAVLARGGYCVVAHAQTGRHTIEQHITHHPNLVLMSASLPEMDGITATRLIRRIDPTVWVVLYEAEFPPEKATEALHAGASLCISYPSSAKTLLSSLDRLIG